MKVETNYLPLVRINAPELYKDEDFVAWLNDETRNQATWHVKGQEPGEFSDIFMTFDGTADGSDSDMPEHCWEMLCEVLSAKGLDTAECLVWLSNLDIDEEDDLQECDQRPQSREGMCLA